MIVGVDLDNTITNTNEKILEYQEKFMKEEKISSNMLWNDVSYKEKFFNLYLRQIYNEVDIKDNVVEVLNNLRMGNNKIYIITARSDLFVSGMYNLVDNYLIRNNIKVDKIFVDGKDKVDVCIDNDVDIMIEDNRYNYDRLVSNNIKTILYDEHNENLDVEHRVSSWKELEYLIYRMKQKQNIKNKK